MRILTGQEILSTILRVIEQRLNDFVRGKEIDSKGDQRNSAKDRKFERVELWKN
jgi:hypothetical protein